ncbi:MAG: hypothetical protein JJU32_13520 [Phormidium sp. BM_Day4_Bin.17]|nr:hypothetical protein [Phormidium sp. BM_Day4_Bin.17]UCJ13952.1 MAG: hypothetical protein JWS08_09620 [Phormidium sp. PBR-2020]
MSTYTGRYQSRFFNFVAEQSLRLGNATAKAARHVRFAAQTAVQAVLYPVYAIFQTARRLDRQFSTSARQAAPLPAADRPIEDVLEEAERLNLTSEPIRAIASSCSDGQLLLITPDNRPLDVIPPSQQEHLDQYLLKAIASYWHQTLKAVRPAPKPYPVRVFNRAMRWVQRSPLALSLNWFEESELVQVPHRPRQVPEPDTKGFVLSPQSIALIDRQIAHLENEYLLPIVEEPEPAWVKVRLIVKAAIDYFFGSEPRNSDEQASPKGRLNAGARVNSSPPITGTQSRRLSASGGALNRHGHSASDRSELTGDASGLYYRVQELIEQAIAYFFDLDSPHHPKGNPTSSSLPDPWDSPELPAKHPFDVIAAATAAIPLPEGVSLKNPFGEFPTTPLQPDSSGEMVYPNAPKSGKPQVFGSSSSTLTHPQDSEQSADLNQISRYAKQEWQPEFKPEWIEAYVNDVRYVRHPLETVLHWLDSLLLKLETWVINIWNKLFNRK